MHLLCFCRNRSPDGSIWRVNRRDSQYNRVLCVFPFPKLPAVGSLCFWMPVQIENFYHTFPHDLVEIALSDGSRFPMCRRTSGVFFDCFLNVRYSLAHVLIISIRSRTVQKVLVTPAAIAGVKLVFLRLAKRDLIEPVPGRKGAASAWQNKQKD